MSTEGVRLVTLVRTATDFAREAARRAGDSIRAVVAEENLSTEHADACIERITAAVLARIVDPSLGPPDSGMASDAVFQPFLATMAMDLVTGPDEPRTAPARLQALRAVTSMQVTTSPGRSGAAGSLDHLRARLRAPDAFELLIEVAHDFRSPLTSILFLADTIRNGDSGPLNALQRSQLGLIYSAALGLASVASDVMDIARQEEDLVGDDTRPYAIHEVFDSVIRLVRPVVEEKGLELRIEVPDRAHAHGHPHALSRVLLNLTTNALKYTDEGYVGLGARPIPRSRIEFWVQDTGRGIPEHRRADLYRPFKRRTGDNREGHFFSGSGVGLSIARRLVRAMGSDLVMDTTEGQGTRFSFELPLGRRNRAQG